MPARAKPRQSPPVPAHLTIGLVIDTSLDTTEGVPQYVLQLGAWLSRRGHLVHYLAGETQRDDLANLHSLSRNINLTFNGTRSSIPLPSSRRRLRRFMAEHDFDVLHIQTPHHPLLAQRLVLAAGSHTAVIGTFHILPYGWAARVGSRVLGWWLRPSLRRFDRMLAVSPAAAAFCLASFGLPATVVPNVVDYELFHQAKPLSRYDDQTLTILFLGRLVRRKGCQLLLEAVAQLVDAQRQLPPLRVVICGRGPLLPDLQRLVAARGLDQLVSFVGFVSEADKPHYYASADLAVFPSHSGESFGIVLLEAMAGGHAAVLAGDNPGYRSVMEGRPDLLFDPTDAAALADKLARYLSAQAERRAAAAWGTKHAQQFDINRVGQQLLDIYYQALHKRRQA